MFKHYSDLTDDFKSEAAYKKHGGFALRDKELLGRLRSSGTEVIKMVGKKIFSGKFNLTQISFPIKCMQAKSIIQCIPMIQSVNSFYLNYAASIKDPLERFKVVMTCTMALIQECQSFEKPLNPVLGETYQAKCADGADLYVEQTSHHPPISHYLIDGPDGKYTVSGHNECRVKFSVTSINVNQVGHKKFAFHDGQTITCNHPKDSFYSIMMGTLYNQVHGKMEFHDQANGLYGYYEIGNVKKRS